MKTGNALTAVFLLAALLFTAALAFAAKSYDFRAFYCAGEVVAQHADPYRERPLKDCEQRLADAHFKAYVRGAALPAPLPGYDLALFAAISRLPYPTAANLWLAISLSALAITAAALQRLCRLPIASVIAACVLSLGAASIALGELVPLCVAALATGALFARAGRWRLAAGAAALALIEPHIGLPAVVSLAVWAPRARWTLAACVAGLTGLFVAATGIAGSIEYLTQVLPAHALSELTSDTQLSLSALLAACGVPAGVAVLAGSIWYGAAATAGILWAGALTTRFRSHAFAVAIPPAVAVLGGSFIHLAQMAAAIPAALLLFAYAPRYRTATLAGIVLLAEPWRLLGGPVMILAGMAVAFVLVWQNAALRSPAPAFAAALAVALIAAGAPAFGAVTIGRHVAPPPLNPYLAEASWARVNAAVISTASASSWLLRAPTWTALLLICYSARGAARRP